MAQATIAKNQIDFTKRLEYLGGSDAAGVLDLSRWSTPLSIWAQKTGAVTDDKEETLAMWLGSELEEVVAKRFMLETGKKVHRVNETIFHPQHPYIGANLDRRVVGEDAILECKTASPWKSKEWEGEDIPREYILQCVHYLAVTGKKRCYLAVLIGNQDFKMKIIERDEALIANMITREAAFWNEFVVPKIMPTIVTKYDADVLDKLYPQAVPEKEIILSDEANILAENLQALKADKKSVEGLIDLTENQLKRLIGDHTYGITSLHKIGWVNSKWSGLDGDRLKAERPEIHAEYFKSKPTRRFSVKNIQEAK